MRILLACEESQTVANAFREYGHEAYSCDLIPCGGGHSEYHIQADAAQLLKIKWDMVIAHPPCTYLSNAGANRLRINGEIQQARMERAIEAKKFFMLFYNSDCPHIAIENPIPSKIHGVPPYNQIIQPYMFGDPWMKTTCLWLRGLPILMATEIVQPTGKWVETTPHGRASRPGEWERKGKRDPKDRSKTFPGIAKAMAEQWGRNGGFI
ncbi:MAG: DNA cytosine methyltransferase [Clostridia bacterium]|nr:DNA cytosine methyltransferase [Clostridia bacterium]